MKNVLEELKKSDSIRAALLLSESPNMFCAGADLKVFRILNARKDLT